MKEIKYKAWEHLVNSLITLTIIGGIITFFIETNYANKYKVWIKRIFIPLTIQISKNLLNEIGKDKALDYSQQIARRVVDNLDISDDTKDLIKIASKKVITNVIDKIEKA